MPTMIQSIISYLYSEIEGAEPSPLLIAEDCDFLSRKNRFKILTKIKGIVIRAIQQSPDSIIVTCTRWISLRKRLEKTLSAFRVGKGGDERVFAKIVGQGLMELAKVRQEELLQTIDKVIDTEWQRFNLELGGVDNVDGLGSVDGVGIGVGSVGLGSVDVNKNESKGKHGGGDLGMALLLLERIGMLAVGEERVLARYQAGMRKGWSRDGSVAQQVQRLRIVPGLFRFPLGLVGTLRQKVQEEVGAQVLAGEYLPKTNLLTILQTQDGQSLDWLLSHKFPKQQQLVLQQYWAEAIKSYLGLDPFKEAITLLSGEWPNRTRSGLTQLVAEVLAGIVKEDPEKYTNVLIVNTRTLLFERVTTRAQIKVLKVIAAQVSDYAYFEEAFVTLITDSALRGLSLKRLKRVVQLLSKSWRFQLKRRVDEIIRDFSTATEVEPHIWLIHANSFRWPKNLSRLHLPDIPRLSGLKQALTKAKQAERIKIEWIDTHSTVELKINDLSTTVTLLQYYLITKVQNQLPVDLPGLSTQCPDLARHLNPLLKQAIFITTTNTPYLIPGPKYEDPQAWLNLFPEYVLPQHETNPGPTRKLTTLCLDSLISRTAKHTPAQSRSEFIQTISTSSGQSPTLVEQRLNTLITKGLLEEDKGLLTYVP
ncbi:hypothetical protein NEHOM01_1322 [Nematocida homosporus]|uniref:uncharacterized protein n=1 Tax=Nematocida homosporus TaxID=1912981 RepID=UPI00221E57D0|nr:uncharacterized protein NEHOM01_1322 [Nematocida homosporus]KAI5186157.1 hypothetical protein NEHOM01_1322 [Nematocida homosporus]